MFSNNCDIWIESQGAFSSHHSFGFSNMLFLKKKLSIKIAYIYSIQVNLKRMAPKSIKTWSHDKTSMQKAQQCKSEKK